MATSVRVRDNSGDLQSQPPNLVVTTTPDVQLESESNFEPPSPSAEPILMKGNLQKKGKRFKGWHQRYFELQGTHMYYYKNSNKTDCLGEIDLSLCVHCVATTEATFGAPFEIHTTHRRHVLSSRSDEERAQWVEVIRAQMVKRSGKKTGLNKPKRWQSFKNAFKIHQHHHQKQQDPKKKNIMDKLRFKRARTPLTLRTENAETQFDDRPLSMLNDEIPKDTLEALLDNTPSRSLPATPLTKKKPEAFKLPASPGIADSEGSLSPISPTVKVLVDMALNDDLPPTGSPTITLTTVSSDVEKPKEQSKEDSVAKDNEMTEFQKQKFTWDEIRVLLEESDETNDVSCDSLPAEDQVWMKQPCGIEQLRAFLVVCY